MSEDKTRIALGDDGNFVALRSGFRLGKYELKAVLGQGGFGITYRAWDSELNRAVAIKEYLPFDVAVRIDGTTVRARSRGDEDSFKWGLERFLDEARALARFEDAPSIVRVYDYLQANGTAYMVMALIEGTPLAAVYRDQAPISEARLKAIAMPVIEGLRHVHRAGFLHRDIKPSNILIRPGGEPVLIDFGAARQALGEKSRSITSVFTPGYAPFEQYTSSGRQGPWTDIYALAATLYHGVAGKPPPAATDRVGEDAMEPATRIGAKRYSRAFLAAIDAGLIVFEIDRPSDIVQWRAMLAGEMMAPVPSRTTGSVRPNETTRRRRRTTAMIGVGLVIVATGGGAAALVQSAWLAGIAPFLANETAEQRAQRLAEQARLATEQARLAREVVETEARRRAEEEERLKAEAEARQAAQEETQRQAADAQRRIEAAARERDEAALARAEEEARKLAQEQADRKRQIDEQTALRLAAEEARRKAEAELAEARRQASEAQKQAEQIRRQADEARTAADAEAKRQAEAESRKMAEEQARRQAEAETRAKAEADAAAKVAAEKARAEVDARAKAEAKRKADADAARKAEIETKARTAVAEKKAEADAKKKAESDARLKAETEAKSSQSKAREEAAPQSVAAAPAYRYAGSWTWTITCPEIRGPNFFAYWSFQRIERETFDWSFSGRAKGTVSGRINGDRMSFRQDWVSDDGNRFHSSFTLTASGNDVFSGSGFVGGFTGGTRDRSCTIRVARGF